MHAILRQVCRAACLSMGDARSDAQLLESLLSHRDEVAFEALVRRHGPMVLGVCRRVAGNAHDAEDAFQATFVLLVRRAASLHSRQLLPGWLCKVAYRTALHTRTMAKKRRAKEQQAAQQPRTQAVDDGPPEELLARLDEELNRLPDRYRLPVVLCELQGRSRKQAAQLLGLPTGTVSWRLAHARKLLAQRLARYGTMLSAGAVTAVLSQSAAPAVPVALVRAVTLQAVMTGMIPAPIQVLTERVVKAMLLSKLKVVWGVVLAVVVSAGAVGMMYRPAVAADPQEPRRDGAQATEDELDELRLEIAALRKGLQATRERVKTLENQLTLLRPPERDRLGAGRVNSSSTEMMMQMMRGIGQPGAQTGGGNKAGSAGSNNRPGEEGSGDKRSGTGNSNSQPGEQGSGSKPSGATKSSQEGATRSFVKYETTLYKVLAVQNDSFAAVQAALNDLRTQPNDPRAMERLQRAVKRLEMEHKKR